MLLLGAICWLLGRLSFLIISRLRGLHLILVNKTKLARASFEYHRAVKHDEMTLAHEHNQVLEVNERKIMNDTHINAILAIFLESKLLHD